jgi:hypothetical protein
MVSSQTRKKFRSIPPLWMSQVEHPNIGGGNPKINSWNLIIMKNDRRTAQQLLPLRTRSPEAYMFLGVRMKIFLSSKNTGGQFSLIEGLMPPGGATAACTYMATRMSQCTFWKESLRSPSVTKSSLLLQERADRAKEVVLGLGKALNNEICMLLLTSD